MDRQYVGVDFHRRRSVIVRLSAAGEKLSTTRVATRELRELVRYRAKLVGLRSGLKAQVHAVMAKEGVLPTVADMFGGKGNAQLDGMAMADGDDAGGGTPRCEHTVSMEVPTEVAVRAARSGCLHEEGQLTRYETTTVHCADGRVLHWNEAGWGYDNDTWHPRGFNQTVPVPPEERSTCKS